jgi:uncharacterized membrane protein
VNHVTGAPANRHSGAPKENKEETHMNWAHVHLLLTHVPVIGVLFGLIALVVALVKDSKELKVASLSLFVIAALLTIPVYFTGEPAEEVVEHLPGVAESLIEQHEEAAQVSLVAMGILGVIALTGLIIFRRVHIPRWFTVSVLALALVVSGSLTWTANLGGQIRHTEIRSSSVASLVSEETEMALPNQGKTERQEAEEEDD